VRLKGPASAPLRRLGETAAEALGRTRRQREMAESRIFGMRILILQNNSADGPAYLGTWLRQQQIAYDVVNFDAGEAAPANLGGYTGLAVLGGPMSVNDDLPSLRASETLIRDARDGDKPVIGHCLGGQLIASALGAKVDVAPQPEIGWWPLRLTSSERAREWFGEFAGTTPVAMQWHYDCFAVPAGAELLASNDGCAHQAFAISKLLAMQFHIEIDGPKHGLWLSGAAAELADLKGAPYVQTASIMASKVPSQMAQSHALADRIYSRFVELAAGNLRRCEATSISV